MENISKSFDLRKLISYLQIGSLWILIIAIPFRMGTFPLWAMISAGVFFFAEYFANKRWNTWHWDRNKWLYVAMIAYYLFIPIWQIGSDTFSQRFSFVLEERMPLLLCGIIGLLGFSDKVKLQHVCYAFIIGCVLTSLYIIFKFEGVTFFTHSLQKQSCIFKDARIKLVNSHMMYNLYLNISLVFALYLLQQDNIKRRIRAVVIAACIWIFYLLGITEGRIGFFTALLIGSSFLLAYTYRYRMNRVILLISMTLYIAVSSLIIMQHGRFKTDNVEHDPRWLIWQASFEIIKERPLTGYGVCDAKELFIKKAMDGEGELQTFYKDRIHHVHNDNPHRVQPHNAFLETWSEFGIIGVVTLLFIFIFPLTMQPKEHRFYIFLITGCFWIQCMTDSFFSPLLYSLAIILFTSQSAISKGTELQKPDAI